MPGPGHFTISDEWTNKMKNPGFGGSKRYNLAGSREGPGPGNYNPSERTLSTAPSYTMSGGCHVKGGRADQPGPGAYNPSLDYAKENLGGVKIGTNPRGNNYRGDGVPGPGNYNVSGRLGG